jgi:hypothetical protein
VTPTSPAAVAPAPADETAPAPTVARIVTPTAVHAQHATRRHRYRRPHEPAPSPGFAALLRRMAAPALAVQPRRAFVVEASRTVSRDALLLAAAALGAVVLASGSLLTLSTRGAVRREA